MPIGKQSARDFPRGWVRQTWLSWTRYRVGERQGDVLSLDVGNAHVSGELPALDHHRLLLHGPEQGKKGFCPADISYDNRDVNEVRDHVPYLGRLTLHRASGSRPCSTNTGGRR